MTTDRRHAVADVTAADPDERIYPVAKLAAIVTALGAEGVTAETALAGTSLAPGAIASARTRVSLNQILAGCRNAMRLSQNPAFAYQTGLAFHVSTQGMYGFAILSSTDCRQAVAFAVAYHRLATPLATIDFSEQRRRGIWTVTPVPFRAVDGAMYKFLAEMQFGIHIALHRDVMGADFAPEEIDLAYGSARDARKYAETFGCPVRCGQPDNRLIFDASWLDVRPRLGHDLAHAEMMRLCDELLDEQQLRTGTAGKVRQTLLASRARLTSLSAVARHLNTTERTLRRRLQAEKASFRQILGEVRALTAAAYLRDTDLPVADVATALGFRDDASFRIAFRRWTGHAPLEYRRAMAENPPLLAASPLSPVTRRA